MSQEKTIKIDKITFAMSYDEAIKIITTLRTHLNMVEGEELVNKFRKQINEQIIEIAKEQGIELPKETQNM